MNEYPTLVKDEKKKSPKKPKDPELKLSLWEKQQIAKHEQESAKWQPCEDDYQFKNSKEEQKN